MNQAENRYAIGGLAAPVNNGGGLPGRWGAANAIFVPEPATLVLAALGLLALPLWVRRRRPA